jgi:hypothetical protein
MSRVWSKAQIISFSFALLYASVDGTMAEQSVASIQDTYDDFSERLIATERLSAGAVTWKGLWFGSEFDALASEAPAHVDDCVKFLADPNHTDKQKSFAIYVMYKTPLRDYIVFARKFLDRVDRGDISYPLFYKAIAPYNRYVVPIYVIFDSYDDPEVQVLLHEVLARPGWSAEEKREIAWIAEGGDFNL